MQDIMRTLATHMLHVNSDCSTNCTDSIHTAITQLTGLLRHIRFYLNVIYVIATVNLPPQFTDDSVDLPHFLLMKVQHGPFCGLIIAIQVTCTCFFNLYKLQSLLRNLYYRYHKYSSHLILSLETE